MANISNTYEGLSHSYSMWYPKSTWLFPQANNFKLWSWLFSQYMFQRSFPAKYPNPCQMRIPRTFLQKYLGQSPNTLRSSIAHMCEIHVLKEQLNSSSMILDISYVLGVISIINNASDDDVLKIQDLFLAGDKDGLKSYGFRPATNFSPPPVSSLDDPEKAHELKLQPVDYKTQNAQKLTISDDKTQNAQKLTISGVDEKKAQFLTILNENSQFLTILGREEERKAQILTILESGLPENVQILSVLAVLTPDDWTGELAFSFENGEIDVIGTKSSIFNENEAKNTNSKSSIFNEKCVNFCASNRQFLSFYRQFLTTVYNRYNIDIIKYNTEFDKSDQENQSLRNQINVLLEKNQNNQVEAFASSSSLENSNVWIEENEEGNVTEDDNKLQMGYDIFGEFDWYTKRELEQFAQEKLKDPVINTVYRLIKDKFEDGSQITGKEYIEYLKEVLDELFVAEVTHPETGELVEASIDTIVGEDWDEERLTDDEKERYEEIFRLIELKRFCRYEHKRIFPYFQHEGRTVFVNYTERPYQSLEERYEEFQRLHSLYEHSFTDEQIELMDFEKHEILVERFNEQFPENEKHMVNDMVRAMQDNMVDIGLFKIGNYEYNSYSVLNGFDGMIRIRYSEDCLTGIRMPFKTIYEQQEEIESERRERDLKLLKSNESMVYSDELDYSELLEKFKPARIKLTPEGKIPAKPSLSEALKYLGFVDGKVLEEWEMNQICDTLLKKYNRSGSGVGNFNNILSVCEYNTYNNRYTLKGVASENVTENDTINNEEEKPYIPLPREKRRTTSRR